MNQSPHLTKDRFGWVILSYVILCGKTARENCGSIRSGNSSDLNSACLKALVAVEIFQFSDMHYESRFLDTFRGHNIRPIIENSGKNVLAGANKKLYRIQHPEIYLLDLQVQYKHKLPLDMVNMYFCTSASLTIHL